MNKNQAIKFNKSVSLEKKISAAFKVKLTNLNKSQIQYLEKGFGIARKTYNLCLDKQKKEYEENNKFLDKNKLKRWFNSYKLTHAPYMKEITKCANSEVVNDFNKALSNFFKTKNKSNKVGFPQFKRKGIKDRFRVDNENSFIQHKSNKSYITLPHLDKGIQLAENLVGIFSFNNDKIKIMNYTFSKKAGNYFVSIGYELDSRYRVKNKSIVHKSINLNKEDRVGIDLGLIDFAVVVDSAENQGTISSLKTLAKEDKLLKHYHHKFSKARTILLNDKKTWSMNKQRYHKKLIKQYEKIANYKHDILHKLSRKLVNNYKSICIEDLAVSQMMKNNRYNLSKSIHESMFYKFRTMLEYKALWEEVEVVIADRYYPSSKTCSSCNVVNKELQLSDRSWTCKNCNETHDRDINAAKNLCLVKPK